MIKLWIANLQLWFIELKDKRAHRRFQQGRDWAKHQWDMRDTAWSNPDFEQRDRDAYARALIKGYIEIGREYGAINDYERGIEDFLKTLNKGGDNG